MNFAFQSMRACVCVFRLMMKLQTTFLKIVNLIKKIKTFECYVVMGGGGGGERGTKMD